MPKKQRTALDPASADGALSREVGLASRKLELADPDRDLGTLDRRVNQVAEAAGIAIIALITLLIFLNACLRYMFSTSLIWGDELAISLIPWLAFIGLFLSVRRRQYIRINLVLEYLPVRVGKALELASHALSALVFAYLAWGAFSYVSLFGGDRTTYLELPKGIFMSALLVGAVAVCLAFVLPVRRRSPSTQSSCGTDPPRSAR
jgi:TRAP-type C4-dicarboxylate transport system permease small subunit